MFTEEFSLVDLHNGFTTTIDNIVHIATTKVGSKTVHKVYYDAVIDIGLIFKPNTKMSCDNCLELQDYKIVSRIPRKQLIISCAVCGLTSKYVIRRQ